MAKSVSDGGFRERPCCGATPTSAQTEHLDRWDADPRVRFIFGLRLPCRIWCTSPSDLPARWPGGRCSGRPLCGLDPTAPRARPERVKEPGRGAREFENQRLASGGGRRVQLSADGLPKTYRLVVVQEEHLGRSKGEETVLFDELSCTSSTSPTIGCKARPTRSSFSANERCQSGEPAGATAVAVCGRCVLRWTPWRAIGPTW